MERADFISSFDNHFGEIADVRKPQGLQHELRSILMITILGVICGADEFTEIEEFGLSKKSFLSSFLNLKHGIPSLGAESIDSAGLFDFGKVKYVTEEFANFATNGWVENSIQ